MKEQTYHIDVTPEENNLFRDVLSVTKEKPKTTNFKLVFGIVFAVHLVCAFVVFGIPLTARSCEKATETALLANTSPKEQKKNIVSTKQTSHETSQIKEVSRSTNGDIKPKPPTKTQEVQQLLAKEYIVKKGDTINSIAKKFRTSTSALVKLNSIKNQNHIIVGQKLKLM
jgi:LysM repeat protein